MRRPSGGRSPPRLCNELREGRRRGTARDSLVRKLWYVAQAHSYFPSTYANNFQVMKMCSAFAKLGVETTLVVPSHRTSQQASQIAPEEIWTFYAVPENFRVAWLPFPYPSRRLQRSVHSVAVALYAKRKQISFVYTRSEWVALLLVRLGISVALEVHNIHQGFLQHWLAHTARTYPQWLAAICVSQALADELSRLGFPDQKLLVAPDGVDLDRFSPVRSKAAARAVLQLPEGPVVGHVGHLYAGRGIEHLLSCAEALPATIFMLVGGRPEDVVRYEQQARTRGVHNVHFTGVTPNHLIPTYLYASDILLMPYTAETPTHRYMSPMKMFEYMAAGRPIIASDFPVLREVLHPGENSLLVTPSDPQALLEAIIRLQADPQLAERLGQQARHDVEPFTWERRASRIITFLNQQSATL